MVKVSWDAVESWIWRISNQIKSSGKEYDQIYGVTRGGLIPAVMLSHQLDIPMAALAPQGRAEEDRRVLIVDEIYDTGKTIQRLAHLNPAADFAVLIHKTGLPPLNYYGKKTDEKQWFVFPWEEKANGPTYYL